MINTNELTKDDIRDLSIMCYKDTKAAAKILFPDRFYRDFDKEHDKIFDLIDNSDNPRKVIAAPRGTGKTSIMNLLIPAKKIAFLDASYVVPVSSTSSSAEQQAENLKHEFMHNPILRTMFNVKKTRNFSKSQWSIDLADGQRTLVFPKGAGQQVRGMLFDNSRPDLVIVDDLENDENLRSEEQRKRLKEWFFGPLVNIVDRGRNDWEIIYIDTLKHEDSLLQDLIDADNWDSVVLELCDDAYESNYPNMIPSKGYTDEEGKYVEGVDDMVADYKSKGQLDVFYREYRNMPIATTDRPIQQSYFQYYETDKRKTPDFNDPIFSTVMVIDPAKTAKMTSADSAIVGGSINLDTGELYFRDIVSGKWHPDELYREMVSMINRLKPQTVGVEVTGLNEFVTYPMETELRKHAPSVKLEHLHARGGVGEPGKVARVRSLVSFYRQNLVYHNPINSGGLEAQLLSFPRSKRWDIMDAAAYFVELFEKGQKYAASRQDDIPTRKEVQEELDMLGYRNEEQGTYLEIKDPWS